MITKTFDWVVGYTNDPSETPKVFFDSTVPGAVQTDYAKAMDLPPYQFETNFKEYAWMEDVYWVYRATIDFDLDDNQAAALKINGIDYRFTIRIDGKSIAECEGMFTPFCTDISSYAGTPHQLEVIIHPVPKADESSSRSQARYSCKPAACYGWDWHPRLVSSGIYDEAYILIHDKHHIEQFEVNYTLNEALNQCQIQVQTLIQNNSIICIQLCENSDTVIFSRTQNCSAGLSNFSFTIDSPKLWFPRGYGEQAMYTLKVSTLDATGSMIEEHSRKIGFRRSRLVMNDGSWSHPRAFPKSRSDAPATIEINGIKIFAKGSNWVNAHIFPGLLSQIDYGSLLSLVSDANMNILRIWGGGFVNHETFYELCDEMGIMIWQEFPLACNEYPDDDHYLSVLEQEATSIVRKLRTHPCLVLWCGGNELFNGWSKMTDQHHALRLLDKICYTEDRFTPFIMTSPLNGMAHGHYLNYDEQTQEEFITTLVQSSNTAYTEFGSPGAADPNYIRQYISPDNYTDCTPKNKVWTAHHAFNAWRKETWLRKSEVEYYYGGYKDIDDLCFKTQMIQAMCYKSYFEEMRRQWPHCSMALNWCFNEPWPTFANNSLVSWPNIPKPSYYSVQEALRPQMASLRVDRHLWWTGDIFNAEVWILNDCLQALSDIEIDIIYAFGDEEPVKWGTLHVPTITAQRNLLCGAISFRLSGDQANKIHIWLNVSQHPEMSSKYTYLCRTRTTISTAGMLNV